MKITLAFFAAMLATSSAFSQSALTSEDIGRAYGQAVTKAVLLAETLVLMEKKCPNLLNQMDYLKIIENDRRKLEAAEPKVNGLVAALVPATTEKMIETDGGCSTDKLKERHSKMQTNFAEDAMGLMQGTWLPKK